MKIVAYQLIASWGTVKQLVGGTVGMKTMKLINKNFESDLSILFNWTTNNVMILVGDIK